MGKRKNKNQNKPAKEVTMAAAPVAEVKTAAPAAEKPAPVAAAPAEKPAPVAAAPAPVVEANTPTPAPVEVIENNLLALLEVATAKSTHQQKEKAIAAAVAAIEDVLVGVKADLETGKKNAALVRRAEETLREYVKANAALGAQNDQFAHDLTGAEQRVATFRANAALFKGERDEARDALSREATAAKATRARLEEDAGKLANLKADLARMGVSTPDDLDALAAKAAMMSKAGIGDAQDLEKIVATARLVTETLRVQRALKARIAALESAVAPTSPAGPANEDRRIAGLIEQLDAAGGVIRELEAQIHRRDAAMEAVERRLGEVAEVATRLAADDDDDDDGGGDGHTEPLTPPAPADMLAAMMSKASAAGIRPETLMNVVPRVERAVLALLHRVITPLVDGGVIVGTLPASLAEAMTMNEVPFNVVAGADPNHVLDVVVAAIEAAVAPASPAGPVDGLVDTEALARSRTRLAAAFGDVPEPDDSGCRVWGTRTPVMAGFAIIADGEGSSAIAQKGWLDQPYAIEVRQAAETKSVIVKRIEDRAGRLTLVLANEDHNNEAAHRILMGEDEVVSVTRALRLREVVETKPGAYATWLCKKLGHSPGKNLMYPGRRGIIDGAGKQRKDIPEVNLGEIWRSMIAQAAAAADL